jgi:hypothetical protein
LKVKYADMLNPVDIYVTLQRSSSDPIYNATPEQVSEFLESSPVKGYEVRSGILCTDMSAPIAKEMVMHQYDRIRN